MQGDEEPVRTQCPEKYSNCNKNMVMGSRFPWTYVLTGCKISFED